MKQEDIIRILDKYNLGQATPEEKALVESWYLKYEPYKVCITDEQIEKDEQESLNKVLGQIKANQNRPFYRMAVAASIIVLISCCWYLFKPVDKTPVKTASARPILKHDLAPGSNKAILTLANGSEIVLNQSDNGILASQGNMEIKKTGDGRISYVERSKKGQANNYMAFNTATTPKGGQFQLTLSDGTRVWLNSATSIKYPAQFNGSERRVELTGEAYFEVAHNARKPFRVVSNKQVVEVLGTHFNVKSYTDENVTKTTLLEGSVKVTANTSSNKLKPGFQSQLSGDMLTVASADVDEAVAWKNGYFYFSDDDIKEVMRQLSRWYDVDIKYEGQIPVRVFSGKISKNINASQILDLLSFKKIHFRIEGKTITVTP